MIRGTTAQFKFDLPYKYNELLNAKIVFWQPGNNGPSNDRPLPIAKVLEQCTQSLNPCELCVTLNQEETLRFSEKRKAYVQLIAGTSDGNAFASKQEEITVYPIYSDDIIDDMVTPAPEYDGFIIFDGGKIQ